MFFLNDLDAKLLLTPLTLTAVAVNGRSRAEYVAHLELRNIAVKKAE